MRRRVAAPTLSRGARTCAGSRSVRCSSRDLFEAKTPVSSRGCVAMGGAQRRVPCGVLSGVHSDVHYAGLSGGPMGSGSMGGAPVEGPIGGQSRDPMGERATGAVCCVALLAVPWAGRLTWARCEMPHGGLLQNEEASSPEGASCPLGLRTRPGPRRQGSIRSTRAGLFWRLGVAFGAPATDGALAFGAPRRGGASKTECQG